MLVTDTRVDCGIPIRGWLIGYFTFITFQTVTQLYLDHLRDSPLYQARPLLRKVIRTTLFVGAEALVLTWLIYGNFLYYSSDSKSCADQSALMTYLMLAILIIGYFHFLVYIGVCLVVLAVYSVRMRRHRQKLLASVLILRGLVKTKFSQIRDNVTEEASQEQECIICWCQYKESDEIVKLKCNEKHYFHTECIESWIKGGNNSCPMCREPINREV